VIDLLVRAGAAGLIAHEADVGRKRTVVRMDERELEGKGRGRAGDLVRGRDVVGCDVVVHGISFAIARIHYLCKRVKHEGASSDRA